MHLFYQVVQTKTFDPYEALVDMGTSEVTGVKGEGLGGSLLSTTPIQDEPQQGLCVSMTTIPEFLNLRNWNTNY